MFSVSDIADLISPKNWLRVKPPGDNESIDGQKINFVSHQPQTLPLRMAMATVIPVLSNGNTDNTNSAVFNTVINNFNVASVTGLNPDDSNKNDVGGIDLEKVNMMIKAGSSKIKTAFDDPRVLKLLIQAQGLFPQVQSIHPMNAPMMNLYLGLNTETNDPIKSADKDSHSIPKSAWLNKASEVAML